MTALINAAGQTVTVPDDTADDYLKRGWSVAGRPPATTSAPKKRKRSPRPKKGAASPETPPQDAPDEGDES